MVNVPPAPLQAQLDAIVVPPQNRNPDGTYPKGVSGNPGGRPVHKPITEAYKRILELSPLERQAFVPQTSADEIALHQVNLAAGKASEVQTRQGIVYYVEAPSVPAAREIADRTDGKSSMADEDRDALGKGGDGLMLRALIGRIDPA